MDEQVIHHNLIQVRSRIALACRECGRDPATVRLLAVTKTQPPELVQAVVNAGCVLLGENRVQEARDKSPAVTGPGVEWHLIGPLQGNKIKPALELFSMIHTVATPELGEGIARQAPGRRVPILIQVNVGREPQKSGVDPERTVELVRRLAVLPELAVRGLMAIPPQVEDPERARPWFRQLALLARQVEELALPGVSMAELSMGMSHDFAVAIAEGATLVRVGSAIFGPRLAD